MGNKGSKLHPKTIRELQRHLGSELTDADIKIWYEDYQLSLSKGQSQLTKRDFIEVYDKLFSGDAREFAEHVFRTFDADGDGSVDFQEFAAGLFVSSSQDTDKKLDWAFRVYDINGDGYITKNEMAQIIRVRLVIISNIEIKHRLTLPKTQQCVFSKHVTNILRMTMIQFEDYL